MMIRQKEFEIQRQLSRVVVDIERTGLCVDVDYCNQQAEVASQDIRDVKAELNQYTASVNWASPMQITAFLHDELRLTPSPIFGKGEVKRGERAADRVALEWIGHRHPEYKGLTDAIIRLRRANSGLKYMTKLPKFVNPVDGLVHPVIGPLSDDDDRTGAKTGRWGIKSPELMQLPSDNNKDFYACRKAITGMPGEVLIAADQSQLEMVILAHITTELFGEPGRYLASFLAPGAPDLHSSNARGVYGGFLGQSHPDGRSLLDIAVDEWKKDEYLAQLRNYVKSIWYGLQYGKDTYGFGRTLLDQHGMPIGEERAAGFVAGLKASQPAVQCWQDWVAERVSEDKYSWSLGGRIADFRKQVNSGNKWEWARAYRKYLNFPMQASGADILAAIMIRIAACPELKSLGARLCLQVHDEVVLRCQEKNKDRAMELVKDYMETTVKLSLPMRSSVGYGKTYWDAK